jgi:4,5-DOPA dioxygenase extradiol
MKRKKFLYLLSTLQVTAAFMKLNDLNNLTGSYNNTMKMPVLFIGHGSPMNAIGDNEFVHGWREIGKSLPKPGAVLCISAHWETRGTHVTAMAKPPTIHDFGGFPKALFDVQYPAPGSPELAKETKVIIKKTEVGLDDKWGLDHGCWSVIRQLYPEADIPVIQLSLDYYQTPQYHYELAKELSSLRSKGVLIIGSGNIVHNLGMVAWDKLNTDDYGYDWAREAKEKMKEFIIKDDHKSLIDYKAQGREFNLAIPTPEHYLPMLYTLALKEEKETLSFFNDKTVAGSIAMTSFKIAREQKL